MRTVFIIFFVSTLQITTFKLSASLLGSLLRQSRFSPAKTSRALSQQPKHQGYFFMSTFCSVPLKRHNIKLLVCDMAGTTVDEGGLVYETLRDSLNAHGLEVTDEEIKPWHGAQKTAVIEYFCQRQRASPPHVELYPQADKINNHFVQRLEEVYFSNPSSVSLISPELPLFFERLSAQGIKIALNTGYSQSIQETLIHRLGLDEMIHAYISSSQVEQGRPSPHMIHQLMKELNISTTQMVAKVGDTALDIEEGKNAQCGLTIGVLSGADDYHSLKTAGADFILPDITHMESKALRSLSTE